MGRLIPSFASVSKRMTAGERRFAERLESLLGDDYLCWYDVPVGSRSAHPDFVVLHPSRGLLVIEVKDWRLDNIKSMDKVSASILTNSGLKQFANPLEQARQYAHALSDLFHRDPALVNGAQARFKGRLIFPWGYGVALPNVTRKAFDATNLREVLSPDSIICRDEMTESVDAEQFQQRLWNLFKVEFPCMLTMPQIDRIRWHLFPEIRVDTRDLFEQGSSSEPPVEEIPDLIRVMDLHQEQLARSMGEGHRVVHGVAGSGKTMILGYRCQHLARTLAKPVLVLCYNRVLAAKLDSVVREHALTAKLTVRHFHGWCRDQLVLYDVPLPEQGCTNYFDDLVERVIGAVEAGQIPRAQYGAVLIDEGHDFDPAWLKLVTQMVDPETNSLLLLYDDAQSLYGNGSNGDSRSALRKWGSRRAGEARSCGSTTAIRPRYLRWPTSSRATSSRLMMLTKTAFLSSVRKVQGVMAVLQS